MLYQLPLSIKYIKIFLLCHNSLKEGILTIQTHPKATLRASTIKANHKDRLLHLLASSPTTKIIRASRGRLTKDRTISGSRDSKGNKDHLPRDSQTQLKVIRNSKVSSSLGSPRDSLIKASQLNKDSSISKHSLHSKHISSNHLNSKCRHKRAKALFNNNRQINLNNHSLSKVKIPNGNRDNLKTPRAKPILSN